LTEYYCESYNLKKGYQKLSKLLFGLPTDFSYSIRICALWAKESESERIKKTNDFRPLDTPWRDASVFWNRADCSSRGTGIQTIPIEFSAGSRSENLRWLALLRKLVREPPRPSSLRLTQSLNCHRNNKESRKLPGQQGSIRQTETIAVSLNRRETWHKFNCAINLKYYQ